MSPASVLFLLLWMVNVHSAHDVVVQMQANWAETSILAEASEFFRHQGPVEHHLFLSKLSVHSHITFTTAKEEYEMVKSIASNILDEEDKNILDLALSTRYFAPAISSFQKQASSHPVNCDSFFVFNGSAECSTRQLQELLERNGTTRVNIFGLLGSPSLNKFYEIYAKNSHGKHADIAFYPISKTSTITGRRLQLSGYGVELLSKNTEYNAQNVAQNEKEVPSGEIDITRRFPILTENQTVDLGFKLSSLVLRSLDPLETFAELSGNLPYYLLNISSEVLTSELNDSLRSVQEHLKYKVSLGESFLLLNGIHIDKYSDNVFKLLQIIQKEMKLMRRLALFGITSEKLPRLAAATKEFDADFGIDYRPAEPICVNDLEKDAADTLAAVAQKYYSGRLSQAALNLFNMILIVNPTDRRTRTVVELALKKLKNPRQFSIRLGVIFAVDVDDTVTGYDDVRVSVLNMHNFIAKKYDEATSLESLYGLYGSVEKDGNLTARDVITYFKENYAHDPEIVFGKNSMYSRGRNAFGQFLQASGLGQNLGVLFNGKILDDELFDNPKKLDQQLMKLAVQDFESIMGTFFQGELEDTSNVTQWLLTREGILPRINKKLMKSPETDDFVDFASADCSPSSLKKFEEFSKEQMALCILKTAKYLARGDQESTRPITVWVVADVESREGRQHFSSFIRRLKYSNNVRVALIFNIQEVAASCTTKSISSVALAAIKTLSSTHAKQFISKLLKEDNLKRDWRDLLPHGVDPAIIEKILTETYICEELKIHSEFSVKSLGLKRGESGLVVNGRKIGPFEKALLEEDVALLEKIELLRGAKDLAKSLEKREGGSKTTSRDPVDLSDQVFASHALIKRYAEQRTSLSIPDGMKGTVTIPPSKKAEDVFNVQAIVDPLSKNGQHVVALVHLLKKVLNTKVTIIFNPQQKMKEFKNRRLYQLVVAHKLSFDESGKVSPLKARFPNLPQDELLTLTVLSPSTWLTEASGAKYDLDNIVLSSATEDVLANFTLQNLIVEGHCIDENGRPTRGLQFDVRNAENRTMHDTIVMENLGYFQLKANPGPWVLKLRKGRSTELFDIKSAKSAANAAKLDGEGHVNVVVDSFTGSSMHLQVHKKIGREEEPLLVPEKTHQKLWRKMKQFVGNSDKPTINVFSVASGHLYERFMKIMMVSVMKNTESPVKFWLLKNYLSPKLKEEIPLLSAEYGFEYEFVEYKWPAWLRGQEQKHRVMWGYKILFLDVLFPLDIDRIIFIDADLVVRADLAELVSYDLGGAPYGYVPFCDSRTEMKGYRFWDQGFWKGHLGGKPYHISALYVVDLGTFRQKAIGDILRSQYQHLSQDPNSLSNLDQDLPNYLSVMDIPIASLPQDWLWCETWCSDQSKRSAKTIDLCNNPMTKEPKLQSAQRIITEWREYDNEVVRVLARGKNDSERDDKHSEL